MTNTPYDDVFRTLLTDCTELIIPVVNEIFHMNYTGKEQIYLLQNEHFIQTPDNTTQERITDSSFKIIEENGNARHYHIECQSTEDGSMLIRMFEYDVQIAFENRELSSDSLTVHFPASAILSLRFTKYTPDKMTIHLVTPGGTVSYDVRIFKMKRYTVDELFDKKLFFLIPFHIFSYEKDFSVLEHNAHLLKALENEYSQIVERLDTECTNGSLNSYTRLAILEMSQFVLKHIAAKYKNVKKGVDKHMGGKVLNYKAKDMLNRGRAEGLAEGRIEGQTDGLKAAQTVIRLLRSGKSIEETAALTNLSKEIVTELAQSMNS